MGKKALAFYKKVWYHNLRKMAGCGAVGSALPWGGRGRGFKSRHSDHIKTSLLIKKWRGENPCLQGFFSFFIAPFFSSGSACEAVPVYSFTPCLYTEYPRFAPDAPAPVIVCDLHPSRLCLKIFPILHPLKKAQPKLSMAHFLNIEKAHGFLRRLVRCSQMVLRYFLSGIGTGISVPSLNRKVRSFSLPTVASFYSRVPKVRVKL